MTGCIETYKGERGFEIIGVSQLNKLHSALFSLSLFLKNHFGQLILKKNLFNLFIFGCVGSSLLPAGFL